MIAWQVDESGPAFSQRRLAYVPHGPDAVAVVAELDVDGFAPEELDGGFLQAARPRLVKRTMKSGKPARRTRRRRFECFMICRLPWCRALVGHGRSRGPAGIKGMLIRESLSAIDAAPRRGESRAMQRRLADSIARPKGR